MTMTAFTDKLRDQMTQRIDEIAPFAEELERLRVAVDLLDGGDGRPGPTLPPEALDALDGVRGVRQRQALELVSLRPGITAQEIADELGLDAGILYAPVRRLIAGGHVVKRGRGLYLG